MHNKYYSFTDQIIGMTESTIEGVRKIAPAPERNIELALLAGATSSAAIADILANMRNLEGKVSGALDAISLSTGNICQGMLVGAGMVAAYKFFEFLKTKSVLDNDAINAAYRVVAYSAVGFAAYGLAQYFTQVPHDFLPSSAQGRLGLGGIFGAALGYCVQFGYPSPERDHPREKGAGEDHGDDHGGWDRRPPKPRPFSPRPDRSYRRPPSRRDPSRGYHPKIPSRSR